MVAGLIVGAIIALFCFLLGYLSGARFTQAYKENVVAKEDHKSMELDGHDDHDEMNEIERFAVEKKEREQRKITADLFRTRKGLLSYKKFVRE